MLQVREDLWTERLWEYINICKNWSALRSSVQSVSGGLVLGKCLLEDVFLAALKEFCFYNPDQDMHPLQSIFEVACMISLLSLSMAASPLMLGASAGISSCVRHNAIFAVADALAERLRTIFVPYFRYLDDLALATLGAQAASQAPPKKKKRTAAGVVAKEDNPAADIDKWRLQLRVGPLSWHGVTITVSENVVMKGRHSELVGQKSPKLHSCKSLPASWNYQANRPVKGQKRQAPSSGQDCCCPHCPLAARPQDYIHEDHRWHKKCKCASKMCKCCYGAIACPRNNSAPFTRSHFEHISVKNILCWRQQFENPQTLSGIEEQCDLQCLVCTGAARLAGLFSI